MIFEIEPGRHSTHSVDPILLEKYPFKQGAHSILNFSIVPLGQRVQEVAPVILEIEPGGHSIHFVAPIMFE